MAFPPSDSLARKSAVELWSYNGRSGNDWRLAHPAAFSIAIQEIWVQIYCGKCPVKTGVRTREAGEEAPSLPLTSGRLQSRCQPGCGGLAIASLYNS